MIDRELALDRIVVNPDDNYPSYLGAPTLEHRTSQSHWEQLINLHLGIIDFA